MISVFVLSSGLSFVSVGRVLVRFAAKVFIVLRGRDRISACLRLVMKRSIGWFRRRLGRRSVNTG